MSEQAVFLTLRVGDPRAIFVPGATIVKCQRCGHDCVFSPSSTEIIENNPGVIISCLNCITDEERAEAMQMEMKPTPAQSGEIGRHYSAGNN